MGGESAEVSESEPSAKNQNDVASSSKEVKSTGEASIGGAFELTNQDGEIVKNTDFAEKFMLVYFGFTNCPMVCPTDMAVITQSLEALGDKANEIQPIFITVDPKRDNPAQIKDFLSAFYPSFQGLTGTQEQVDAVAKAYRTYYAEVDNEGSMDSEGEYTMDHSAYIYLMGRDGKYITHYRHNQAIDEIVESLSKHLEKAS